MIITEFYDGQGLGNQLWVYVVTRTISKKLNMPYLILAPEKFKGKEFLDIDYGVLDQTSVVLKKIEDNQINYFKEIMYLDLDLDCFCVDYDDRVLQIQPFTKIDGLFQSETYFFDDLEFFKTLLPIRSEWSSKTYVADDTCVLNIRGGEYVGVSSLILPKSYWENAMQNMLVRHPNIKEFVIVTDDKDYSKTLFPKLRLIEPGIAQSYLTLHQAKYLIVSNSSFSYFPIKTQTKKPFVIAPMHWARFENIWKRWSSPANLYTDWNWLDNKGTLHTYEECIDDYKKNMMYYTSEYNIRTVSQVTQRFNTFCSIKKLIPKKIKDAIKVFLPSNLIRMVK